MPTGYSPVYKIVRDGIDITGNFNDRTIGITVEHVNQDFASRCDIVLDDRNWKVAFPSPGSSIQVWLGYREVGLALQGSFTLEEVVFSGPPRTIAISGSSAPLSGPLTAPTIGEFENKSIDEIVSALAERAGLSARVHPAVGALVLPFRNVITSPLADLSALARLTGSVLKVNGKDVILTPRDTGQTVGGSSVPVIRLGPQHFGTWQVRHSTRTEFSEAEASWFDTDAQVRRWTSASPEGGAFDNLAAGSNPYRIGQLYSSEAEALAAAKAKMSSLVRGSGQFLGVLAQGDPWFLDQQRLQVVGMRDGIDGSYTVATIRHIFNDQGLQTQIEANPSGLGEDYSTLEGVLTPLPGELVGRLIVGANGMVAGGV